jgi:thiol-disulfide isomerase/thioredoxin
MKTKKAIAAALAALGMAFLFSGAAGDRTIQAEVREALRSAGIQPLRQREDISDFTLPLLDGSRRTLSAYKGKVVFLNFWATWCPPCRQEMPSMETLYQRYRGRGLEFLAVDIQETGEEVRAFISQNGLTFPVALDLEGTVAADYGVYAIPSTFIIDRDGYVIAGVRGSRRWDTPAVYAAFDVLLK